MENKQDFEEKIKSELKLKCNELEPSDELYSRIMTDIIYKKKGSFTIVKNKILNMGNKKLVAILIFSILVISSICFGTSSNLRAFAAETINHIKTIFVLEGTNKDYKVVEKSADKALFSIGDSKTTNLSDDELSKKIGIRVSFPKVLCNDLNLLNKSENITLKKISYENAQGIEKNLIKAIDDEAAFKSLRKYEPSRGVEALYFNGKKKVLICITPYNVDEKDSITIPKSMKVDLNGMVGFWREFPYPIYPSSDMTKEPKEVITAHMLFWRSNEAEYSICSDQDKDLSRNEAVNIAKSFIAQSIK